MAIKQNLSEVMEALYTPVPVVVDGLLDDPVWADAPRYELAVAKDRAAKGVLLEEPGTVRLAWDEKYFYLAADFTDRDVVVGRDEDEIHHYRFGEVCELFLKPGNNTRYWELYVTPLGRKTTFFLPLPRTIAPPEESRSGLIVAARVNRGDGQGGWTAEMAMPIPDLTAHGDPFGPSVLWRVFAGRYNYGAHRTTSDPELSMAPPLSRTDYHLTEEYAALKLRR